MIRRLFGLAFAALLCGLAVQGVAADWPQWRGPNRDGISKETGLLKSWDAEGPPLAWQTKGLGSGYSSVVIAKGKIYTMGTAKRGGTAVIALDREGNILWTASVGGGSEPNCTPTYDDGLLYALSKGGDLACVDAETGDVKWRKSFPKDFGGRMMSGWGYSESPLVDGDRLIVSPGAKDAAIVALNKKTGETIWKADASDDRGGDIAGGAGYSSIVVAEVGGVRQYVQLMGRGLIAVAAKDGRLLWNYKRIANGTANIPTPIVKGDYVFCSSGYGIGAALLKLTVDDDKVMAKEVYFLGGNKLQNHHGGMILIGDHVYCGHDHNLGFPTCVELKTGKIIWTENNRAIRNKKSAAIAYADGHLYFRYESGEMVLIEATPDGYKEKGSFKLPSQSGPSWPHPVICDGKLYIRSQDNLLCYDVRRKDQARASGR